MTNTGSEAARPHLRLIASAPPPERSDHLVVTRLVSGLRLRTSLRLAGARGIGIDVRLASDEPIYIVSLVTGSDESRTLSRHRRELSARRVWTELTTLLELPRLVADPDGGWRTCEAPGRVVATGPAQPRRGSARTAPRRPSGRAPAR